jgi:hypothetical protein
MKRYLTSVLLAAAILGLAPGAQARGRVYVRTRPPASHSERRPPAPSRRHVWIPGHQRWDGHTYAWASGRWERPPAHRRAWVRGHWARSPRHGWYWVEGHWRR